MNGILKYDKEKLQEAVKDNCSVMGVLRFLGLKLSGGNHTHIKRRLLLFNIDTSHFTGQRSNKGATHKGGSVKLNPSQILVFDRNRGRRENVAKLKRALLETGVEYKCEECGLNDSWKDKKLVLTIDHKNGNFVDNRRENLRFLCPNCHSQTKTFGTRNRCVV